MSLSSWLIGIHTPHKGIFHDYDWLKEIGSEILLDMRILDLWESELAKMNDGKEGRRYVYPEAFIRLLGYMHLLFHLPYRQTEGFLKALRKFDSRIKVPDYSTIDRRVNKLNIDVCHFLSNSHDFFGYFYFSRRCPTKAFLKFLSA